MSIELATTATAELKTALDHLLPQLSSSATGLSFDQLEDMLAQQAIDLLVYRHEGEIAGLLTLVTFTIPTGVRAWIEDVVVDASARGQGGGKELVTAACSLARKRGAKTVDLTSRPAREIANQLYQSAGFSMRETNVYRMTL